MTPKIAKDSWSALLFVALMSANINASARELNNDVNEQLESKAAKLIAQKKLTELAYKRLLEISEKNVQIKKLKDAANKAKPQLIKASYNSVSNNIASNNSLGKYNKRLKVVATAYTSHVDQTDSTPNIAAWGDRLKPGMKVIAVSRDLLNVYGLKHKQKVRIKGLKGEYLVLDKMNKRWRKKIDIYMGMNKKKAFRWGKRNVEIFWNS